MFALHTKPGPATKELIPMHGDRPAVTVDFNPTPSPKSLRIARRAVAEILRNGGPDALGDAGEAFTRELVRHNIVGWTGIVNEADEVIVPTPDVPIRDPESGEVTGYEPGTISAFLAEPRLIEAADREYVLPWTKLDAEKNGYAPSPSGTSAGATAEPDTAGSPAMPASSDDAATMKPARRRAPTRSTNPKPRKAKSSGR